MADLPNVEFHESRLNEAKQYHEKQAKKKAKQDSGLKRSFWYENQNGKIIKKIKTDIGVQSLFIGNAKSMNIKNMKFGRHNAQEEK